VDYVRAVRSHSAAGMDFGYDLVCRAEEVTLKPVIASREFVAGFATMAIILVVVLIVLSNFA
jgi:hypothetical protein